MEYIKELNIIDGVIHILDNTAVEPILNEFALDLNEEIYTFLYKHIQKCLSDEELKYAIFTEGRNIIKEVSYEYLSGHSNLLDASKELARQMFTTMKSNGNIPSCDLITVSISTEYGPMLGILKMDYVKNYMHNIEFVDNKLGINIIPQVTGLPGSGQKIQKCAIIKTSKCDNKYDLMVLDKQKKGKHNDDYGSNYFIDTYLGCEIINNERDMTKNFLHATEQWTRNNLSDNADKAEKLRRTAKKKLQEEEHIDVLDFAQEIFGENEEITKDFLSFSKVNGVSDKVEVDREWVDKKLKRVRLKIDGDIDLYLSGEAYKDFERFEIKRNGDGSINIIVKHIRNYIEK
ncbi:MAG: nucleoid-associated protein [Clostridium sp.]